MIIGGVEIKPGEEKHIKIPVAHLPSRTPINIEVIVARSLKDGPVLLLEGGLHGDEINGIEIIRRLLDNDLHVPEIGTTITIPVLNVFGFIHFSRDVPDGKDVNRSFPGSKNGSLASKVAYTVVKEILPHIDYGVDFHTGGASRSNYPQLRMSLPNKTNEMLAKGFHAPFSINSATIPKSLRATAAKMNKHIVVYEVGESMRYDELGIQEGISGTLRLLKSLGMRRDAPKAVKDSIHIDKMKWIRASASGLWISKVDNGEYVEAGERIGYIASPFDDYRVDIKISKSGYVVAVNNLPVISNGDALVHMGYTKQS